MSQERRTKSILALVAIFGLLPAAFLLLVFLPVNKRMAADRERLETALRRNQELPNIQPLTAQERALLDDPTAPWRTRIPLVATDAQRLGHYHRVVTDLQRELRASGVRLNGIRSTWNPIQASFTLPPTLGSAAGTPDSQGKAGSGHLQAWVLEAAVEGTPTELFKALESLARVNPLLEPVALRWEAGSEQPKQMVVLRNLVLIP